MTPRKFHALLKVHFDIKERESKVDAMTNGVGGVVPQKSKPVQNGFIDTIPGW